MSKRTLTVLSTCGLVVALATPALARPGVDEGTLQPRPSGDGGGSSGGGAFDVDEGGFVLQSGDGEYKLVVGGRLQTRFDGINWDDADRDDTRTFDVRRARLFFLGHVLGSSNRYFVQLGADAPNPMFEAATATTDFQLFDAWLKHSFNEKLALKFGQFKIPFGRQNLTSSGKLQFPDRALAVQRLGLDRRDTGVEASGGWNAGVVQYQAALVNGDGPNRLNQDDAMAVMGRLSFNPHGDYGYSEGDYWGGQEFASTIGLAAYYTTDKTGAESVDVLRLNFDGGIKRGGASLQGEFFYAEAEAASGSKQDQRSFYVQGGYFLRPEKVEIAARASVVKFDSVGDEKEYSFGVNVFTWGHRLKWQAAYSRFDVDVNDQTQHRVQAQAQLWF